MKRIEDASTLIKFFHAIAKSWIIVAVIALLFLGASEQYIGAVTAAVASAGLLGAALGFFIPGAYEADNPFIYLRRDRKVSRIIRTFAVGVPLFLVAIIMLIEAVSLGNVSERYRVYYLAIANFCLCFGILYCVTGYLVHAAAILMLMESEQNTRDQWHDESIKFVGNYSYTIPMVNPPFVPSSLSSPIWQKQSQGLSKPTAKN